MERGVGEERARDLRRPAAALALGFCVLGLALGATQAVGGWDSAADFYAMYAPGAKRLLDGGAWIEPRSGPGYPALLALLAGLGLPLLRAAQLVAALAASAVAWLSFLTFRRFVDERVALGVQLTLHLAFLRSSFVAGNDVLCAALSAAALWLLLRSARARASELVGAGLCAGLAFATRYPALAVVAAGLLSLAGFLPPREPVRARLARCAAFAAGAALVVGPWLALNLRWHGELFPNRTHALVALELYGDPAHQLDMRALEEMERRFPSLLAVVAQDPVHFARHFAIDFHADALQLLGDALGFPLLLFAGVGALLLATAGERRGLALLLYAALAFALVALAPYQARYHQPIWPVVHLCALLGLAWPWLGPRPSPRALRTAGACALAMSLGVLAALALLRTANELRDDAREVLPALARLEQRAPDEAGMLVARKPHLASRAGLGMIPLWTGIGLEDFLARLRADPRARWLYVGSQELRANPALAPLARGEGAPDWLVPLERTDDPPSCLYRLR